MDRDEFARAVERLSSDLSSLAFEHRQERLDWQRAMEAQAAELQLQIARQDATQTRLDELETFAIELEEQLRGDVKELAARNQALANRLDGLEAGHERQQTTLGDLRGELTGLSRTTDEVFDDIADRVGVFERSLSSFDRTLSKQYEVLTDSLTEAREQLTEGLAEAHEAAAAHADGIVELKDAIVTYQERRDAQDADSREQLAAMRERLSAEGATLRDRQEATKRELLARSDGQEASLKALDDQLSLRLSSQEGLTRRLEKAYAELGDSAERELAALRQLVGEFAAQGQLLAQAIESVQQGSMAAEAQLGTAMAKHVEALRRQLEQSTSEWQAGVGETRHHLRDFEAKVAKALGLQRGENLEHERHLTALRDDLIVLGTRVGTIVQLLTKASRPSIGSVESTNT